MDVLDHKIREIIKSSLQKRIAGLGPIDNLTPNEMLIDHWMMAITFISIHEGDLEASAESLNEFQSLLGDMSLEDSRAFLYLASHRFFEEITAYTLYLSQKDEEDETTIINDVKKELKYIEDGEFMFV